MESMVAQVKLGIELMAAEGVLEASMANTLLGCTQPPHSSYPLFSQLLCVHSLLRQCQESGLDQLPPDSITHEAPHRVCLLSY